jgi:hypothetical protein
VAAGWNYSLALTSASPVYLPLSHPAWNAGVFTVSFASQTGAAYVLEYKNSLTDTAWNSAPAVPGTGGTQTLSDSSASGPQRFYRVRQQ